LLAYPAAHEFDLRERVDQTPEFSPIGRRFISMARRFHLRTRYPDYCDGMWVPVEAVV